MMIQNAALFAEPLPQQTTGTGGGAAPAGAGGFEQLLQGMQPAGAPPAETATEGEPAAQLPAANAALAAPVAPATGGAAKGSPVGIAIAPEGLAAETGAGQATPNPAPPRSATAGARLQLVMTWQALKSDAVARSEIVPGTVKPAGEGAAKVAAQPALLPEESAAVDAAASEVEVEANPAAVVQQSMAGAAWAAAELKTGAAAGNGSAEASGLAVAAGKVEANIGRRNDAAPAEAGENALSRLAALAQEPSSLKAGAALAAGRGEAKGEAPQPGADQRNIMPSGADAGAKLGQKAETAAAALQAKGPQQASLTGATEGAQVEVPVRERPAAGVVVARAEAPVVKGFTPTPLQGASFPTATDAGKGGEAQATAAVATGGAAIPGVVTGTVPLKEQQTASTAVAGAAVQVQEPAQEQAQEQAVEVAPRAAARGEAAAAGTTQQGAQAEAVVQQALQGAEKGQERRELRQGEARPAMPVKEADPAQQPAAVTAAPGESAGTTGVAAAAARLPEQGAGREGFGSQKEQGHQEQKAQQQSQVAGVAFAAGEIAAAELEQPQARETGTRSALHESILSQVKEGVVSHDGKGNGQMSIRLNPGELGELKIQVRMEDNRLKVEVQADNRVVKDLLMSNLDSLKDALSSKNLAMDGFNVSTGGGFNAPLHEERRERQQSAPRFAKGGAYGGQEEARVNYLTAEVNNLLDVRF